MNVPAFLLLTSLLAAAGSVFVLGPYLSDLLLMSLVSAAAAGILLLRDWITLTRNWIVLDGSNILYWTGDTPDLDAVRMIVEYVQRRGLRPIVWFDANVGHLTEGRYLGPGRLAPKLGLRRDRVFVVGKGKQADPFLLDDAVRRKARVISNDRFRDWMDRFPEVSRPGFLVATQEQDGNLVFKL